MSFQRLILGNQTIETETQRRKFLLGGYLMLLYLGVDLYFFVVNIFNVEGEPLTLFIGAAVSLSCLLLIRMGWIDTAIAIHLLRAGSLAFYFTYLDTNPYETATFLYFIPASLGALAVYGYRERWKGLVYTAICFFLFLIALFNYSKFNPSEAHFYFISNFIIVLILGVLIILFFDSLSFASEQRMLHKNAELQKANSELDRFVYSASHDLRAPLTSILGLINLSELSGNPQEVKNYLAMMRSRILILDKFIHDIIDYSRNSRLELVLEQVDLKSMLEECVSNLEFMKDANRVAITMEVEEGLNIRSEVNRLKMIFNNLISNGIKYFDPHKSNPKLLIKAVFIQEACEVTVEDNGIGIAADRVDKIFDMFYKANENSIGSGLGLYIVKECAAKLNGTVTVSTTLGEGSCFKLVLPRL